MRSKETKIVPNDVLLGEVSSLLKKGKEVILLAKGTSMQPFIKNGSDSVRLKKHESVRTGDIVLARTDSGNWVLHRVFGIDGEDVTLMGDGNIVGKEKCRISDIAGTVEAIVDRNGKERMPSSGKLWRMLLPFRRYILGIYRRLS
ncbi:MAG: S24/S26 family peptidase [Bacteroidales bacterium]|nr:S24/S26 family peptidase [Bacteroidales bacterium]